MESSTNFDVRDNNEKPKVDEMTWKDIFRRELSMRNVTPFHHRPDVFYTCQWEWPLVAFLVYRVVAALYILIWCIYSMVKMPVFTINGVSHVWPSFLTNWSYFLLTVYLCLAAVTAVYKALGMSSWLTKPVGFLAAPQPYPDLNDVNPRSTRLSWYLQAEWVLFCAVSNFALIVTLIYFGALYPRLYPDGGFPRPVDFHIHGVNSIIILIDIFLSSMPVRLVHIIYPILYGLCYVIFSLIYWGVDHKNVIYKGILDWNKPGVTIGVIISLALIIIPLFQLILFGLFRLRLWIYKKIYLSGLNVI